MALINQEANIRFRYVGEGSMGFDQICANPVAKFVLADNTNTAVHKPLTDSILSNQPYLLQYGSEKLGELNKLQSPQIMSIKVAYLVSIFVLFGVLPSVSYGLFSDTEEDGEEEEGEEGGFNQFNLGLLVITSTVVLLLLYFAALNLKVNSYEKQLRGVVNGFENGVWTVERIVASWATKQNKAAGYNIWFRRVTILVTWELSSIDAATRAPTEMPIHVVTSSYAAASAPSAPYTSNTYTTPASTTSTVYPTTASASNSYTTNKNNELLF